MTQNGMPEHGGRLQRAAREHGIPLAHWIDLSTGINPRGWPVPPLATDDFARLPEADDGLETAAADYYGSADLLPVAGSQEGIRELPRIRLERFGRAGSAYSRRVTKSTVTTGSATAIRLSYLMAVRLKPPWSGWTVWW